MVDAAIIVRTNPPSVSSCTLSEPRKEASGPLRGFKVGVPAFDSLPTTDSFSDESCGRNTRKGVVPILLVDSNVLIIRYAFG